MKAYLVAAYGPDARFEPAEIETPSPGPGQILIEVAATSLNPVDHKILTGGRAINPPTPAILHMDVAGTVTAVGEGVERFSVGDAVYGCAGGIQGPDGPIAGALADFMVADADLIAGKPACLGFGEAAALPLVAITAYEALFDRLKIGKDDHILVHGGAGGVGHVAVQMGKIAGARVATTVSDEAKADIARGFGADDLINYRTETVEAYVARLTGGAGFPYIFDTIGGANLDRSLEAAANHGQVAGIIGMNQHDLSPMHTKSLSLHIIYMLLPMLTGKGRAHHGDILRQVAQWAEAGTLAPLIHEERFSFAQANEAHALFAAGGHQGKIVLER